MQQPTRSPRVFTLPELFAVLLILSITAAILFPVVTMCKFPKPRQQQCLTNEKQIGLAALMYAQDNDGFLPPVGVEILPPRYPFGQTWMRLWLGKIEVVAADRTPVFSLEEGSLFPYLKTPSVASCPDPTISGSFTTYVTNDLCDGAKPEAFTAPAKTVLATDGDGMFPVTGHSLDDPRKRFERWNQRTGQYAPGSAAMEGITRHDGGANYILGDGHVQHLTPTQVFFPPRESMSRSHRDPQTGKTLGPDPAGDMIYKGYTYTATFHLH